MCVIRNAFLYELDWIENTCCVDKVSAVCTQRSQKGLCEEIEKRRATGSGNSLKSDIDFSFTLLTVNIITKISIINQRASLATEWCIGHQQLGSKTRAANGLFPEFDLLVFAKLSCLFDQFEMETWKQGIKAKYRIYLISRSKKKIGKLNFLDYIDTIYLEKIAKLAVLKFPMHVKWAKCQVIFP